ncbi:MAG TPA: hypothetical protein VMG12_38570 [Polyangiaceae bacterium]|nr:hypothetical protein [Polyangiaceae bacterium]
MGETTIARKRRLDRRQTRGSRRATLGIAAASLPLLCCDGGDYPIAPTACDDWCLVTQRAGCEEDYPEGCVSNCEDRSIGRRFPRCEPEWSSLTQCYRAEPDSSFLCVEDESRPRPVCIDERVALTACAFPLRGQCLEACLREARDCGQPQLQCEARCRSQPPGCDDEQRALYACQLAQPADCQPPTTDTRDVSEIPCITEIGALLECAGLDGATSP